MPLLFVGTGKKRVPQAESGIDNELLNQDEAYYSYVTMSFVPFQLFTQK